MNNSEFSSRYVQWREDLQRRLFIEMEYKRPKQIELSENSKDVLCRRGENMNLTLLQIALEKAVKDERYEYAAKIRDEIARRDECRV
jgi:excinuclease UvrABC helicase subunit UvrB